VNCLVVWEKIPKNVKRHLTPLQKLKQAHVTRICSKSFLVAEDL